MDTLLDYIGNDQTSVYHITEYGEWPSDHVDLTKVGPGEYYLLHRLLCFGDYDNSCQVERSNVRVFMERFGKSPFVKRRLGAYGSELVMIDVLCNDEEIIETLCALDNYAALDDQDCSLMEIEMEDEAWDNFLKQDFKEAVEKHFEADDSDPDEDKLRELYNELREKANEYGRVESGGNFWIDVKKLAAAIDDDLPWMKLEYWFVHE